MSTAAAARITVTVPPSKMLDTDEIRRLVKNLNAFQSSVKPKLKRIAWVEFSYSMMGHIIKRPFTAIDWFISSNLPADATVAYFMDMRNPIVGSKDARDVIRVYMESESFAEVPEGQVIPPFDLIYHRKSVTKKDWVEMWPDDPTAGIDKDGLHTFKPGPRKRVGGMSYQPKCLVCGMTEGAKRHKGMG